MRIAFDIDGTILTPSVRIERFKTVNNLFEYELYDEYPIWKSLKKHGLIGEDFDKSTFYKEHREALMSEGEFYQEFKDLYWNLVSNGHEVYFVTARRVDAVNYTRILFQTNGIPYKNVHFVGEGVSKVPCLKRLKIDVFYEDNVNVTEDILKKTDIKIFLLERPYNKECNLQHKNFEKIKIFQKYEELMV